MSVVLIHIKILLKDMPGLLHDITASSMIFYIFHHADDQDRMIDCRICPMKGDTLLHIPLGSNHGVIARGSQKMHYLWIDCTPQELKQQAVDYLNEVHKPTGEKQTLE